MLRKTVALLFVGLLLGSSAAYAICVVSPAYMAIHHAIGIVSGKISPCEGGGFRTIFRLQPVRAEDPSVEVSDEACGTANEARLRLKTIGTAEFLKKNLDEPAAVEAAERLVNPAMAHEYWEKVNITIPEKAITFEYELRLARRVDPEKATVMLRASISKAGKELFWIEEPELSKARIGSRLTADLHREFGGDLIGSGRFGTATEALRSAAENIGICHDYCHGAGPDGLRVCVTKALN